MKRDTDPDMREERTDPRGRPVLSLNLSWRQIAVLLTVLGLPGGGAFLYAHAVDGDVQVRAREVAGKADQATVQVDNTAALYRTEQLRDRAELHRIRDAVNSLVEELAIQRSALAAALDRFDRQRARQVRARPTPPTLAPQPRPPLPAPADPADATRKDAP